MVYLHTKGGALPLFLSHRCNRSERISWLFDQSPLSPSPSTDISPHPPTLSSLILSSSNTLSLSLFSVSLHSFPLLSTDSWSFTCYAGRKREKEEQREGGGRRSWWTLLPLIHFPFLFLAGSAAHRRVSIITRFIIIPSTKSRDLSPKFKNGRGKVYFRVHYNEMSLKSSVHSKQTKVPYSPRGLSLIAIVSWNGTNSFFSSSYSNVDIFDAEWHDDTQ